jgi:D-xylose 1-dehydrogenase (NADP+, D-xylono-1,5-lactone-forming)
MIKWGVLSTANIGRKRVIPAIQKLRNGDVVAVASRSIESAQAFADENGIPQAYGSYEALFDAGVDVIYNPLPNSLHKEWALRCAEAGIPMLCEKPLALDADEAQTMVDAFKAKNVLFAEAFMYRFHPQIDRVRDLIQSGAIGDLHLIDATFTFALRTDANIRLDADLGGGSLMDVGCYCINIMRHLTGEEPADVLGAAYRGDASVDVNFSGTLRFPSGVMGHFASGLRTFREHAVTLLGSTGKITLPQAFVPEPGTPTEIYLWQGDQREVIAIDGADSYQLMVEDFADALTDDRPPRFDPQDAVNNMRVIDRLLRA